MDRKGSVILGLISMLLVCACLVGVFSMAFTPEEDQVTNDADQGTNNNTGGSNTGTSGGATGGTNTGTETVSKYQLYSHESYNSSRVGYRTIGTETWYFAVYQNPYFDNPDLDVEAYDVSTWYFEVIEDNVIIYEDMNVIIKYSFDYGISWNTAPLLADESGQGKTIYCLSKIPSNKTVCISYTVVSNDKDPEETMQELMNNVFTSTGFRVHTYNLTYPGVIVPAG